MWFIFTVPNITVNGMYESWVLSPCRLWTTTASTQDCHLILMRSPRAIVTVRFPKFRPLVRWANGVFPNKSLQSNKDSQGFWRKFVERSMCTRNSVIRRCTVVIRVIVVILEEIGTEATMQHWHHTHTHTHTHTNMNKYSQKACCFERITLSPFGKDHTFSK
jgi:hypothetical protein